MERADSDDVCETDWRPDCAQRNWVLTVPLDFLHSAAVLESVEDWRVRRRQSYITFVNPHSVMLCGRDDEMHSAIVRAGLRLPDGIGIIAAARMLRYRHCGRLTGSELMLRLCADGREHGYRHYFYGGQPGVAERLAAELTGRAPGLNVIGCCCPPFRQLTEQEDSAIVDEINSLAPDIVWVGLGAPKQEKWMAAHVGRLHATALIGVGAAFDFLSGNIMRAPEWMRNAGLEWAFRLLQNPRRLWRRNLDSPLFLAAVIRQTLGSKGQLP